MKKLCSIITLTVALLVTSSAWSQGSVTATYSSGDIPTTYQGLSSNCSGLLDVDIPAGNIATTVDVIYDMTALSCGWISEQISLLSCLTTGNSEDAQTSGTGNQTGTLSYSRTGLTIAQGAIGTVSFELQAGRMYDCATAACSTAVNKVDNGTWTITVNYVTIPNCIAPNTLAISNIAADGADVSFVSGNTTPSGNYEYELVNLTNSEVADGSTDGTATTNTFTLSGLVENASYEIYIKEICGFGDASGYSSLSWTQTEIPGCATNFSPAEGDTTYTGSAAVFTWDAPTTGGTATSYDFYYGLNGAAATNLLGNYTTQTETVYGFPAGSHNYLIVPKNANGVDAISCTSINFNIDLTPQAPPGITCDAGDQSTSQFTESFDAQGSWTGDFGGAGGWQFDTNSTGSGGTGPTGPQDTGGSYMYYEASNATGSASAVSPVIDLSGIDAGDGAELSFYMHAYGSAMGLLNVGASTSANGPFTNIFAWGGQLQTTSDGAWSQVGADVSAYTGGDLYIQFTMTTRGSYLSDMSIDTMEVVACTEIPSCPDPSSLAASGETATTVDLDWTDGDSETLWDIELVDVTASASATGTPTTEDVTTNPYTLSGLTPENDYEIYLRADCSGDNSDASDWIGPVSFTTLPTCPDPSSLAPSGKTTTTVDLGWTAGGTESLWNIEVYEQGADTSTATPVYTETGVNTNSTTATGLTFGGDYTAYVQADCGATDGVSDWIASNNFSLDYCESTPTSNDASGISNVQLGTTDFPTGDVYYADYRDTVVDIELGNTANLQVSFATGYTYDTNVWIDFNDDLVFDATELVFDGTSQSTNPTTLDASFDIAIDAAQGNHYMRIGTADSGQSTPNPCYEGSYGVTIDMAINIIIGGGCTALTTWDGTAWSNGAPDANSYAVMSGAYSTGTDGAVTACVMQVDAAVTIDGATDAAIGEVIVKTNNTLTIDESSSLTVSGDFTNSGGTVTLNSTADDFSSLIVTGTATGDITYNRYVNVYDDTLGGGWDLVCSPVDMTIADFITANGANIEVLGNNYAFAQFNNATGQWERYATASQTGSFTSGQGYSMATTAGATVAFTGDMQTTSQSINVINNDGVNGVGRRWNLVSNPYPSYINGNTAAQATNNFMDVNSAVVDDSFLGVYGWNGSSYTTYNNTSDAFSIAPGQAFWVAALNTEVTALNFTAAMRTTTGTGDFVSGPQPLVHKLELKLFNGDMQQAATKFYFRDGLSLDLDPGYDAGAFNQTTKLSTRLAGGSQEFAFEINAMGIDALQNTRVPLEIRQNAGQAFRVSIADMELPEDIYVYLEDTVNGTLTSLKDADFELVAQSNLSGADRFFIVFKSNSVLSNGDTLGINALNVFKANNDDFVTIAGITPDLGQLDVRLYSMLGQTVRQQTLNASTATQRVSTSGLASGLYMVQIKSGNQTTVKKVIIK